jgi:serine/threonine protein kinase
VTLAKTEADLNKKILRGDFSIPSSVLLSSLLKKFLRRVLSTAVDKRPTVQELLQDDWFLAEAAQS